MRTFWKYSCWTVPKKVPCHSNLISGQRVERVGKADGLLVTAAYVLWVDLLSKAEFATSFNSHSLML